MMFAAALLLAAQVETTPPPPAAPRPARLPHPVEKTLKNGLRVIVIDKPGVPLVAARLLIKSGAEADPAAKAGLADLTAALLTKGTDTRTAEQIARGVEALGATLESGSGWDSSVVNLSVMSSKLPQAMSFLSDVVRHPKFAKDEIDRLRAQRVDELSVALHEPSSLADIVAQRVIFGDAPYAHNVGGSPQSLARITRSDVLKFHRDVYRPDNAVLVIGGAISPENAFAIAEKYFATWSKPSTPPRAPPPAPALPKPRVVVVDMPDAGQAAVVVGRPALRRLDPAYSTAIVTNSVLGGGYSSRLNQEIRIKRGLSYGASSGFDLRRDVGPFTASAQTKNESAAEVAGLIVDEMARLTSTAVADTELGPRKATLIGNFSRSLETSAGIVGRIGVLALYGVGLDAIDRYISGVQDVTASGVQQFAAAHLGDASVVVVGNAKAFIEPLRKRFGEVEVIPAEKLDINSSSLQR
jgi:zinc protease